MDLLRPLAIVAYVTFTALWPGQASAQASAPASRTQNCPELLRHTFERLQDEKPQSLCQYAGKVVLVVNTASFCGFTPQYRALEQIYGRYRERGLVVLGFPSNDFAQEKGSNREIAEFCESTFGVQFPMFAKSSVRGPGANPLFKQLAARSGRPPLWNFHKYLIGRNGELVDSYLSATDPGAPAVVRAIEQQLAVMTAQ